MAQIAIVTPAGAGTRTGNRHTAQRWAWLLRELGHPDRGTVRRDHFFLERHAKTFEHLDGMGHRLPVRRGTHDHRNKRVIGHDEDAEYIAA